MPRKKPWTFLFYLCGDNELAPYVEEDFAEVWRTGGGPDLHVAVQLDRPGGAARYLLPERGSAEPPPSVGVGPVNTGDPAAAIDFLTWGMAECPSRRLAVFLSGSGVGHAAGGRMFSLLHDAATGDSLDAAELRTVFERSREIAGRRVDLIGIDACSVAFLEVAYQLEGMADVLVSPQTYFPGRGWPYDRILDAWRRELRRGRPATPEDLARQIVRQVVASYEGREDAGRVAVSALDLRALPRMARTLDTLALALAQNLSDLTAFTALRRTRKEVEPVDRAGILDLGQLLELLESSLMKQLPNARPEFGEAGRVSALVELVRSARKVLAERGEGALILASDGPAAARLCGASLFFPASLEESASYLGLRFAQRVHWSALLGALNLIEEHPRSLWRLISSLMADASGATRQELVSRMLGEDSLILSLRDQFRALESPACLTLSLERRREPPTLRRQRRSRADEAPREYSVRLQQAGGGPAIVQRNCQVNPATFDHALLGLERLLGAPTVDDQTVDRIRALGRTLSEDLLGTLAADLRAARPTGADGQESLHLRLQIAAELMRYPWELLHDGEGWLGNRYAVGRQVFTEVPSLRPPRRRQDPTVRVLVVGDPLLSEEFKKDLRARGFGEPRQLPCAEQEAQAVVAAFEDFARELANLPPLEVHYPQRTDRRLTVLEMRELLRAGYDVIHFAGHAVFRPNEPDTSAWLLSDGELWAREIRNTLAAQDDLPRLIFANACGAAMDAGEAEGPQGRYQGDVFGLASAFINQGVAAYVAPLWPVPDDVASELAKSFYRRLLLDRTSLGEALCGAKQEGSATAAGAERSLAWASFVLYGEPTPRLLRTVG